MAALLLMAGCKDSETFQPGEPVAADCQEVHFSASNETISMLLASGTEREVTYIVERNQTKGELTLPVSIHKADKGLVVPAAIHFADGSATAEFVIKAPEEVQEGTTFDFDIEISGTQTNPYKLSVGATRFSASISFPRKRYARMWFTGMVDYLGYFLSEVYDLGNGSLLFSNFLQSGTDWWVRYPASATSAVECDITTSPSYIEQDTDNPGCWYLYCWDDSKEENDGYTIFYPHGKDAKVSILEACLYVTTDGYQACIYNPDSQSGWALFSTILFSDKSNEMNWKYINWVFTDTPYEDGYDYDEPDPTALPVGTVLNCTAKYHFDDNGFKAFQQTATVVAKNYVSFADFLGSGFEVKIHYLGDGKMEVISDHGYTEDGIWYFRDKESGTWVDCYPAGTGKKPLNISLDLDDKEIYIDYSNAGTQMKIKCQDMIYGGKKGWDDYLLFTW